MCPPWDTSQPPINIAYLASYIRSKGRNCNAFDLNIKFSQMARNLGLKDLWETMDQNVLSADEMAQKMFEGAASNVIDGLLRRLLATETRCLGFSVHSRNVDFTEIAVKRIREFDPDRTIIYGGPEITISHSVGNLARLSADAYVIGEGEETIVEALEVLQTLGELKPVPGMVLPDGEGGVTELEARKDFHPLDQLPFPAWEDFDLSWYSAEAERSLPMMLSRGCTGKCTFCMDHEIAGRYRCRSGENAVQEFKRNVEKHGISSFHFNDLVCNGNLRKLEEMCDRIIEEELDIMWWSYAVVRKKMTAEHFRKLHASGCSALVFGLESGSDKVLKLMNKYYSVADAEEMLKHCHESGINTAINIIVGFPGETRVEHQETLDFLERNKDSIDRVVNLGTTLLSPGSEIFADPDKFGIKEDERGTWYTDGGNTVEERNRRLDEVQHKLDSLQIPRLIINRERGFDQYTTDEDSAAPQVVKIESPIRIFDVQFLDIAEQDTREFETGDLMNIILRFQIHEPVDEPLIRMQIFNNQNPTKQNRMLFGMNTERAKVSLGRLEPGWAEARLIIYQLNFMPGKYVMTTGLWKDVDTSSAFDVRHGEHMFRIKGTVDSNEAKMYIPTRWEYEESTNGPWKEGDNRLLGFRITNEQGQELPAFRCMDPLRLAIECNLTDPDDLELTTSVLMDGGMIHRVTQPDPLPRGRNMVMMTYDPNSLLEGNFEIQVELTNLDSGEQVSVVRRTLRMASMGFEGGGLMFVPSAWEIHKHPS